MSELQRNFSFRVPFGLIAKSYKPKFALAHQSDSPDSKMKSPFMAFRRLSVSVIWLFLVPSAHVIASTTEIPDLPEADWIDEDDIKVVPAPVQHAPWADGSDTVRLVESPTSAVDEFEVDAEEVAGEVARLRAQVDGDDAGGDADSRPRAEPEPVEVADGEEPSPERDLAKAWSATESSAMETGDDLGSLFKELRVEVHYRQFREKQSHINIAANNTGRSHKLIVIK